MKLVDAMRIEGLRKENARAWAENERLRAAIRDAAGLIDNDLVGPWVVAHKLDNVIQQLKEPRK